MATVKAKQLLGQLLIERGLLSPGDLERALVEQKRSGEFLGSVLMRLGIVAKEQLLPVLAEQMGIPYVHLSDMQIEPDALAKVPPKFASLYRLMPLTLEHNTLQVAIADPFDVQTLDELRLLLDCEVKPVFAMQKEIEEAIARHYGVGASAVERLLDTGTHQAAPITQAAEDLTAKPDEASVISFVNQLLLSAAHDRATDIHIEPFEQLLRVRERIDGVMYEMAVPVDLAKLHQAIVSRIKVMAKMDIAEKRLPQDGRIKVRLDVQELDLRISVLPTNFGESVVVRLLSSTMLFSLEQLGLSGDQLDILSSLIQKPHGIIFVTGPTGSGKTTTLYACLSTLNRPNVKILTIEDPIEYQLTGITQLQVHPKIGFSFAAGLRSMLRHDPDIMMVGEVRDSETAEITIRSALTGHLVFSTLHTNDASGGVTRLLDMGIEPYLVSSTVLAFVGQRLVRVICPDCKVIDDAPVMLDLARGEQVPPTVYKGKGCEACRGSGYRGRIGIYEILVLDEMVRHLIMQKAPAEAIKQKLLEAGWKSMRQDGWQKVAMGITTPEEVLRVTMDD
ncbi:MAG: ATPase, T2SS/T4P/T4SS family [Candidatus Omnitrophota bacterium]|nr:ATPase, T2SS/T4P/T4SS family [Candidatus Omnitrophota bacterium]